MYLVLYLRSNQLKASSEILFAFATDNIFAESKKRFSFGGSILKETALSHTLATKKISLLKD